MDSRQTLLQLTVGQVCVSRSWCHINHQRSYHLAIVHISDTRRFGQLCFSVSSKLVS